MRASAASARCSRACSARIGWEPILEGDNIIGLVDADGGGAISLEPGGQFELSGAPLETLHETGAETHAASGAGAGASASRSASASSALGMQPELDAGRDAA